MYNIVAHKQGLAKFLPTWAYTTRLGHIFMISAVAAAALYLLKSIFKRFHPLLVAGILLLIGAAILFLGTVTPVTFVLGSALMATGLAIGVGLIATKLFPGIVERYKLIAPGVVSIIGGSVASLISTLIVKAK